MRIVPRNPVLLTAALSLVMILAGCATRPPASDPEALAEYNETNDPLEPANRVFYTINNGIDTVRAEARRPGLSLRGARAGPHRRSQRALQSHTPVVLSNDMMQGKPRRAGDTTMRFLINTTVGVVGVFDFAKNWGYPAHDSISA